MASPASGASGGGVPARTLIGTELTVENRGSEENPVYVMLFNGNRIVATVSPVTSTATSAGTATPVIVYLATATQKLDGVAVGGQNADNGAILVVTTQATSAGAGATAITSTTAPGSSGIAASTSLVTSSIQAGTAAVASNRAAVISPVISVAVHLEGRDARNSTTRMAPFMYQSNGTDGSLSNYYYVATPTGDVPQPSDTLFFSVTAIAQDVTAIPRPQAGTNRGGGLSAGAGAGIGIGCALVGALIAFIVTFLLFKRKAKPRSRRRHRSRGPSSDSDAYDLPESKMIPAVATTVAIPHDSAAAAVFNNKPLPKEDNYISDEFSRIKTRIDNHINTYYLRSGGNDKAALDAFAQLWAAQSPVPLNRLPSLLADSRSRAHILRAGLAWIVARRIVAGNGGAAESFLPAGIANAYADLSKNRLDPPTRSAFLSEWRVMTATLSGSLYGQEIISADDPRLASIRVALGQADKFLAPLASSADHETRTRHLEEIMKRAARLGWTLFSQPSEFQTDWTDEGRGVVVFPGLLQTTDEDGRGLRTPRAFGQKEVVPL